ncbi:MAG: phosphatase PAP2 family protein [Acidimicrobiaceae bacterium]|nr:phosphatase PAP2 family protein [Acidimicrobiaceae bacterium]
MIGGRSFLDRAAELSRSVDLDRLVPPPIPLPQGGRLSAFDDCIDDWVETNLRGRTPVDRVMYTASALGDHGLIWLLLAAAQAGRLSRNWRMPLLRAAAGLGAESALVNGPVKWMFRRTRPEHLTPRPMPLRIPRTSSFPSGHATAAFFGAALLSEGDPWAPLYYVIAVIVAMSRVHVRIHHASDVAGGIIIGIALGRLARHLMPLSEESPAAARC